MDTISLNEAIISNHTPITNVLIYVDDKKSAQKSLNTHLAVRFDYRPGNLMYHFIHMSLNETNDDGKLTLADYVNYLESQIALVLDRYSGIPINVIFVFDNVILVPNDLAPNGEFSIEDYIAYLVDLRTFPTRTIDEHSSLVPHSDSIRRASILVWAVTVTTPKLRALSRRGVFLFRNIPITTKSRWEDLCAKIEQLLK